MSFSQGFSFSDSVSDDPGPWEREDRQYYDLVDDPAGGWIEASGTGTIAFSSITLTTGSNIGSEVDVSVGGGWAVGSVMFDSVVAAAIDQFTASQTTSSTHTFPINGEYTPRATVWGHAAGDYGGFPFFPFALTSGSYSATGTISAEFTACQEVRLYNEEEQCGHVVGGTPATAPCAGGSGVAMHVHAESGNLVLFDIYNYRCLTVDDTTAVGGKFPVTSEVCSSGTDDMQQWIWHADGTLRPIGAAGYCLAPNPDASFVIDVYPGPVTYEPLVAQPCTLDDSERWQFF